MIHFFLYILRQRAGHSSNIHFICVKSFRFNKYLMAVFICKTNHLIFNRWAVSRSCSFNHTGIKRRSVQICPNNLMSFFIGISQPAGFLLNLYILRICGKRKRHYSLITKLLFHFTVINGISGNSCRSSCFKTEHFNPQFFQRICEIICCLKSVRTCIITYISINTSCL